MSNINLLPSELGPDEATSLVIKKLKRLAVTEFVLFLIIVIVAIGSFIFMSSQVNNSTAKQNEIKSSIAALEATEQRLILLKDRLNKVSLILAADTTLGEVNKLEKLSSLVPQGVSLKRTQIVPGATEISYALDSSATLVQLLLMLKSSGSYSRIELTNLKFTRIEGYEVSLSLL